MLPVSAARNPYFYAHLLNIFRSTATNAPNLAWSKESVKLVKAALGTGIGATSWGSKSAYPRVSFPLLISVQTWTISESIIKTNRMSSASTVAASTGNGMRIVYHGIYAVSNMSIGRALTSANNTLASLATSLLSPGVTVPPLRSGISHWGSLKRHAQSP